MCNKIQCLVLILSLLYETNAYKYLVVSPFPSKSHAILTDGLVEHIVNAGHEVTYITVYVPEKQFPRVTVVDLSDNTKIFPEDAAFNVKTIMDGTSGAGDFFNFAPVTLQVSKSALEHPDVQKLLADKDQQFDAVIAEWMFNDVYAGFAAVFDCPLIWFSTLEPHWMIMQLVDTIPNPAYTADMLSHSVPPFTFWQRVDELRIQIVGKLIQTFWVTSREQSIYNEFFVPFIRKRQKSVPSFEELRYNCSLVLSNSHVSLGNPTPLANNFISIGGFHINSDVKALPEDMQKLMDNAIDGVIYFSMGSNLRSRQFPFEIKAKLLKVFSKLKQTVIWKFEEALPNCPSNVHIVQWAPQQSILAHNNCVLFITHGGLLSTTETVHFGVPIIGIPVFGDQFINVEKAVRRNFALRVYLSHTIAEDLEIAIGKILNDPKYTQRAKELSQIYHDRLVPPAKELVHWVEQVVKTRGATHLRSSALMVPWYQKIYLDLLLLILIIALTLKYVLSCIKSILFTQEKEKLS